MLAELPPQASIAMLLGGASEAWQRGCRLTNALRRAHQVLAEVPLWASIAMLPERPE